ncbi:MAG: efflux RND transporter periplasmic adaptor subunit [Betaproteobacteria bacterium]|nr:efflux RND transporter periplasmic adaptor subunit [Betaproteobacteria bacterium]
MIIPRTLSASLAALLALNASAAELASAPVEYREVDLTYSSEGVVEAVKQSTVSAQISGRIVELRFDVGDYVKKGEVIVRIDERAASQAVAASEAQVREAEAALRNARAAFERTKQLRGQNFVSQAGLDKAESDYKAAQERVAALLAGAGQAATERSFATIVAPYSGVVAARHVELGEMAAPGKPLMTGFDPADMRVVATLPQGQVAPARASGKARVEVPSLNQWIEVSELSFLPAADPRTQTTRVRLQLPAATRGVYPGIFARAHFTVGRAFKLLVPRSAILRRSEVTAAYVIDPSGEPRLRQLRLGEQSGPDWVEVLSGLKQGERVALEPVKAGIAANRPAVR